MKKILLLGIILIFTCSPSFAGDDDFSFIVISNTNKSIIREVNLIKPDLVFQTGRTLEDHGAIETSLHLVPGCPDQETERTYSSFKYKNICFIILNSETTGNDQVEWLKKELQHQKDDRATFVFLHRPLMAPLGERTDEKNRELIELLVENKVASVFSGHDLPSYTRDYKGTSFVTVGGQNNYALITIKGNKFKTDIMEPFRLSVEQSYEETDDGKAIGKALINNRQGDPLMSLIELRGIVFRLPKGNYLLHAESEATDEQMNSIQQALGMLLPDLSGLLAPAIYKTEDSKNAPGMIDVWVRINAPGTLPTKLVVEPE
ncbi:MAG: hypothetical protein KKH83_06250 [Candidatus Margulisbacteria bacterium]|nr:hypothetical protein [Candidatus Margulisiibacteriota bacterium]